MPTPFQVGRVNAYLIEDEPLTLVDSGPHSRALAGRARSWPRARSATASRTSNCWSSPTSTWTISASRRRSRARSGAEVAALDLLAPLLGDYGRLTTATKSSPQRVMLAPRDPDRRSHGLRAVLPRASARWGHAVEITRPLRDGETRSSSRPRRLRGSAPPRAQPVRHRVPRPSRAPILIAADHLLAHISSNPLLALRCPSAASRRNAPARSDRLHRLAASARARWTSRSSCRARRPDPRPSRADRRASAPARSPCREDRRTDRRARHAPPTRSRSRCGATWPSPRRT